MFVGKAPESCQADSKQLQRRLVQNQKGLSPDYKAQLKEYPRTASTPR